MKIRRIEESRKKKRKWTMVKVKQSLIDSQAQKTHVTNYCLNFMVKDINVRNTSEAEKRKLMKLKTEVVLRNDDAIGLVRLIRCTK